MPKFTVSTSITISLNKDIEAASEEEAEEIGLQLSVPGLCIGCSRSISPDEWDVGELDGEPGDITVEARA